MPLPRIPRMRIPGTWEIYSKDGRHGGNICSQTPWRDIQARLTHLTRVEPDADWTYEYIPIKPQTEDQ